MYPMEQAVQDILLHARQEALDMFNSYIGTEHVLLAMCSRKESYLNQLLANGKVPYLQLKKDLEILFSYPKSLNQPMDYTDTMFDVLRMGNDTRIEDGRSCMNEEDLTVALFQVEKSLASEVLRRYGIDIQSHFQVENHILELDELPELTNLNAKMEHSKCVIFEREKRIANDCGSFVKEGKGESIAFGGCWSGEECDCGSIGKTVGESRSSFFTSTDHL